MADWNNPQTGQIYTSHFESIRDKDNALAKMFDGTSETNLPDGAIKINSGSKYRIEKWDASASSWNTVIPGLGDLTQAEVDQLATIGSTTISATQWGYLGGLGSAPLEDDDLAANGGDITVVGDFGLGGNVSSLNDFGSLDEITRFFRTGNLDSATNPPPDADSRRANGLVINGFSNEQAVLLINARDGESRAWIGQAEGAGASVNWAALLTDEDLAANGGAVPETNRTNKFNGNQQNFGRIKIDATEDSQILIFGDDSTNDDNYAFYELNDGTSPSLIRFRVRDGFEGNITNTLSYHFSGGVELGNPSGGPKGNNTLNAEELYDNGNRVYSASNAPASTDLSDHESQVVELGGDFDAGEEVRCERIGNMVTITVFDDDLRHNLGGDDDNVTSNSGVIPTSFRPSASQMFFPLFGASSLRITSDGLFEILNVNSGVTNSFSVSYLAV